MSKHNKAITQAPRLTGEQVLKLRKVLGMSQLDFWSAIGTTQSGGSRYETGRTIPLETEILVRFVYLNQPVTLSMHQLISPANGVKPAVPKTAKEIAATIASIRKELKIK